MHPGVVLIVLFLVMLLSLYFFSQWFTKTLGHLLYRLTHSHSWTIRLMALIFFPGTLIHELAHAIVAGVMFVDIGEITLWPEIQEDGIKLGSVEIYQTDALRRAIIGVAPVLVGAGVIISSLLLLLYYFSLGNSIPFWAVFIFSYILFVIGNTMFSSRRDMEGAVEILIVIALVAISTYLFAINKNPGVNAVLFTPAVTNFLEKAVLCLFTLIVVDVITIGFMKMLLKRS